MNLPEPITLVPCFLDSFDGHAAKHGEAVVHCEGRQLQIVDAKAELQMTMNKQEEEASNLQKRRLRAPWARGVPSIRPQNSDLE